MAARLIAEEGPLQGMTYLLVDSDEWTIGRDPDFCDLVLEDASVSRKHALCKVTSNGIVIENLSASNPVQVNEIALQEPYALQEGDLLQIGSTLFRFSSAEDEPAQPDLDSQTEPLPETSGYASIIAPTSEEKEPEIDLRPQERFLLKVLSGPQAGAEFALQIGKPYILGTDINSCDIVFHDLSVSRQHATITLRGEDSFFIEDLSSRNGVLIDGQPMKEPQELSWQHVVTLGTTSFMVIDRDKASDTIVSPLLQPITAPGSAPAPEPEPEEQAPPPPALQQAPSSQQTSLAANQEKGRAETLLILILVGCFLFVGVGLFSLFTPPKETVDVPLREFKKEIEEALNPFPELAFTFNRSNGRLFLLGHVSTEVEKSQMLYNLQNLTFIRNIDDNVIVDEAIWQQMNALIARNANWRGVAMHSPSPGRFVLTGYLKTRQEAVNLSDYLLQHFDFPNRLDNQVAVEEDLLQSVQADLFNARFNGVSPSLSNGELVLAGFIPIQCSDLFEHLIHKWQATTGIRTVRAYVVRLSPDEAVSDLSGKYRVTGVSKQGDAVGSVIINGRILSIGDSIDGLTITRIDNSAVYLEKSGLKYKITYNL